MAITTVSSHVVSVNAIQGTLIADNAITAVHIATNAVSGTLIADNAITAVHVAQNSITVTQLADDCVESDKIADGVITTNHLNKAMISSQTEVTPVAGDFVLLGDTSDSNNLKKAPLTLLLNSNVDLSTKLNLSGGTMSGAINMGSQNITALGTKIESAGALTIAATSIEGSMLNNNIVSGLTDIGAAIAATDEFIISDAGTIKRSDISRLGTFLAGDGLAVSSGVLAVGVDDSSIEINSDALRVKAQGITNAMLADNAADTDEIADNAVTLAKMAGLARGKIIYGDASGDPAALAAGANGKLLVADANGDLSWTTVSGDLTLSAGALTIGATTVEGSMLNNNIVSGLSLIHI